MTRPPLLAALAGVFLVGCGGGSSVRTVPVSGKATFEGSPMSLGIVTYYPDASKGNTSDHRPTGTIQADGTYKLVTAGKDGAPVGWYKVTINPNGMPADPTKGVPTPAKVGTRYQQPDTTPVQVEVVDSPGAKAYDVNAAK